MLKPPACPSRCRSAKRWSNSSSRPVSRHRELAGQRQRLDGAAPPPWRAPSATMRRWMPATRADGMGAVRTADRDQRADAVAGAAPRTRGPPSRRTRRRRRRRPSGCAGAEHWATASAWSKVLTAPAAANASPQRSRSRVRRSAGRGDRRPVPQIILPPARASSAAFAEQGSRCAEIPPWTMTTGRARIAAIPKRGRSTRYWPVLSGRDAGPAVREAAACWRRGSGGAD